MIRRWSMPPSTATRLASSITLARYVRHSNCSEISSFRPSVGLQSEIHPPTFLSPFYLRLCFIPSFFLSPIAIPGLSTFSARSTSSSLPYGVSSVARNSRKGFCFFFSFLLLLLCPPPTSSLSRDVLRILFLNFPFLSVPLVTTTSSPWKTSRSPALAARVAAGNTSTERFHRQMAVNVRLLRAQPVSKRFESRFKQQKIGERRCFFFLFQNFKPSHNETHISPLIHHLPFHPLLLFESFSSCTCTSQCLFEFRFKPVPHSAMRKKK